MQHQGRPVAATQTRRTGTGLLARLRKNQTCPRRTHGLMDRSRPTPIEVIKLGGSLLDLPDLCTRVARLWANETIAHHVVLVGGGALADVVRTWHQVRPLQEPAAHWACATLMDVNTRLLSSQLPTSTLCDYGHALDRRISKPGETFLLVESFLRDFEPTAPGVKLPTSWRVTSDSIAGRLAIVLGAQQLTLAKSSLPNGDAHLSVKDLAEVAYVDRFFPQLSDALPHVVFANLRSDPFEELHFAPGSERHRSVIAPNPS